MAPVINGVCLLCMKACVCQCESSSEETGGMVLRLRVASAALDGHRKEAAER